MELVLLQLGPIIRKFRYWLGKKIIPSDIFVGLNFKSDYPELIDKWNNPVIKELEE